MWTKQTMRHRARRVIARTEQHYGLPPRVMTCHGCGQQAPESDLLAHHCAECTKDLLAGLETPSGERLIFSDEA